MKISKYIFHIAKINIVKKKQRTYLSLTAICLSTAIIFTSLTLFKNVYSFSKNTDYEAIGNYHYTAYSEGKSDDLFSRYSKSLDSDTNYYGQYQNQAINLRSLTLETENSPLPFVLKEGLFPSSTSEIIVSDTLGLALGDTITLDLGHLDFQSNLDNLYHFPEQLDFQNITNNQEMTFTVVGVYLQNDRFLETTQHITCLYTKMETEDVGVYYVKDAQIQLSDSFNYFIDKIGVAERYIVTNNAVVSNDSIKNFLQDTTILLAMFIIIASIGISMSLISVHNVILISDKDRKKELGLLKSVGARPIEVKRLLQIELLTLGFLGAVLGLLLGMGVSYLVLNLFIERIYVTFHFSMISNPLLILISFISGIALMYLSGMKAYSPYIYTSPINDLKNFTYDYGQPVKPKPSRRKSFEWRMFMIYNGRMKKQTKNIFRSFVLFLMTTVLFISILLSNVIYKNKYTSRPYDFDITNYHEQLDETGGLWDIDPLLAYDLYQKVDQQEINANYIYTSRMVIDSGGFYWTNASLYNENQLSLYSSTSNLALEKTTVLNQDQTEEIYYNLYHSPLVFDQVQLNELKPYLVDGSLDNLSSSDVVAIYDKDSRIGQEICNEIKVGDIVYYGSKDRLTSNDQRTVAAIVHLPVNDLFDEDGVSSEMHFGYSDYPRIFATSLDAFLETGNPNQINEHIYLDLMNTSTASAVQESIENTMKKTANTESYVCNSISLIVETNRYATFIIEALLYPLFLMLFIVSLMNINNVFVGNVHLKRNDISIMKSVGMTSSQLNMLFVFEYIEGYVNAAAVVTVIFVPLALLEGWLQIASSFDLGANIIGTLLIAITLLGVLLVVPLVILSLKKIRRILPIENLKDVD